MPGIPQKQAWHYDCMQTYTNGIQPESFRRWQNQNSQLNHTLIERNASTLISSSTSRKARLGVMPWVLIKSCKFNTRRMSSISLNLREPSVLWQPSTKRLPRVTSWYRSSLKLLTRVWAFRQVCETKISCLKVHLLNEHPLSRIACKNSTLPR